MEKIDYKRELKHVYSASNKEATVVVIPKISYLMIDGEGDPNDADKAQSFSEATSLLYAVSYAAKFIAKREAGVDYIVMPLEGLWWVDDWGRFDIEAKEDFKWTAMVMQPLCVTEEIVSASIQQVRLKKKLTGLERLRFESLEEGQVAQIMHIGPYSEEAPTIARLHAAIEEQGGKLSAKHHEIYLGDPAKSAPDRLKTIIRQPFR